MQSLLSKDYFELFGLPKAFDINLENLIEKYRELQHKVHPDKFVGASDQERRLSMQMAAHINEAFQTLKKPVSRANYLLQLRGIDNHSVDLDNDFLVEQMELRERLDALRGATDARFEADKLLQEIGLRINELQNEFKSQMNGQSTDACKDATLTYQKMQFMVRLQQQIENFIEELV